MDRAFELKFVATAATEVNSWQTHNRSTLRYKKGRKSSVGVILVEQLERTEKN
jgi:hypothetical protein